MKAHVTVDAQSAIEIGELFLGAWLVMLALGDVHLDITGSVPALGYWAVLAICAAVGVLSVLFRRGLDLS